MKINELTPHEYFLKLKGEIETTTNEKIKDSYKSIFLLSEKYKKTGQVASLKKLKFLTEVLQNEEKLIEFGVDKFIYRDIVEDYIDNVSKDVVKIQELSQYTREIPDEIVEVVDKTKNIFDKFYVVFTDYTRKEERKVEQQKRDKDPILFGVFTDNTNVSDRFYYLGDWEDEYCDLTLDKLVGQYSSSNKKVVNDVEVPKTTEELISILQNYTETKDGFKFSDKKIEPKKSFFKQVKTFLSNFKM